MKTEPLVCCVGDLVEDVTARLRGPISVGTDNATNIDRHRGGSAANVAAMVSRSGGSARFVGRVGSDHLGISLVDRLEAIGVEVQVQTSGHTGTIVVLVTPDGERSFLTDRGAAGQLAGLDPKRVLHDVAWMHLPWYSLHAGPIAQTALELVVTANEADIPVSVDASSVALLEGEDAARFAALVRAHRIDTVLCNEDEARALSIDLHGEGLRGVVTTVVKQGSRPALALGEGREPIDIAPSATVVVDTTGAGDAFAAGYIYARLHGATTAESLVAGHAVAACVVAASGADAWVGPPALPSFSGGDS